MWDETPGALYAGMDLFDRDKFPPIGLNRDSIESARQFHAKLDPARRPDHVRYFCFSGTRQTTAAFAAVTRTASGYSVRKVERDDSGDGTVPFWSSSLPGVQCLPVGGEHSEIYRDRALRRTLAAVLGKPGTLGPTPFDASAGPLAVELSVRDKVVEPGNRIRLVIAPLTDERSLDGELRIERADDPTQETPNYSTASSPIRVQYQGPAAESFSLIADTPRDPGAYRFAFYPAKSSRPSGVDVFFVQSPTE